MCWHWILGRASHLLCSCHKPVRGKIYFPVIGFETPRSSSKLWCEVSRTAVLPLGKDSLYFLLQDLSTDMFHFVSTWCPHPQRSLCLALLSGCVLYGLPLSVVLWSCSSESSASFQSVFCENYSICRCIFDVFVAGGKLHIPPLHHHLDLFPFVLFDAI